VQPAGRRINDVFEFLVPIGKMKVRALLEAFLFKTKDIVLDE